MIIRIAPLLMALLFGAAVAAAPVRIAIIYDGGESVGPAELRRAADQRPEARVDIFAPGKGGEALTSAVDLGQYDVILLDGAAKGIDLDAARLAALPASARVVVLPAEGAPPGTIAITDHPDIATYWANRSLDNDVALVGVLARMAGAMGKPIAAPIVYPDGGFYHPAAPGLFADRSSYLTWYAARVHGHRYDPSQPGVGIASHRVHVQQRDTAVLDALIAAVEARGANAITLVRKGPVDFAPLMADGKPVVDVMLFDGEMLDNKSRERGIAQARALGVPMLMALVATGRTPAEYRASAAGLAPDLTPRVVNSEREGLFEPIAVGGLAPGAPTRSHAADAKQVEWRIGRALAWARLHRLANAEKRVVMTYWSEAGGKADVGGDPDDFLDVQGSLASILPAMQARGYDLGDAPLPSAEGLASRMALNGSNVGSWAPGQLSERVASGDVALVPEAEYLRWYARVPGPRRREIEAVWGPPPGKTMVHVGPDGERVVVIPRLQFGNVILAPHPMWGYYENEKVLLSKDALPPHHQYLAFFLWLQNSWRADAWVSMFSNITLQPGKSEGPLADDAIGVLLGAIPHIHPERLGANGGMSTKRKALAQTVGWYNIVVPSDAAANDPALRTMVAKLHAEPRLDALAALRREIVRTGLDRSLGVDVTNASASDLLAALDKRFIDLDRANLPYGGKLLGTAPQGPTLAAMVDGMLGDDLNQALAPLGATPALDRRALVAAVLAGTLPEDALQARYGRRDIGAATILAMATDYAARLAAAPREVEALFEALDGRWIEPGPMGEPFRRPDVLPPGRAVFNFDQRAIPTVEAEAIGIRQAAAIIEAHREANSGAFPQKLAFVLWSGEIAKNNGVTEAQVLHLLGTKVTRNWRGEVTGVALIPRAELGRPRIDVLITTSGTYRDHFQDKVELIAEAARLAATSPEADNPVSAATRATAAQLVANGEPAERAAQLAAARVFAPAPGAYSPSIQFLAKSGDSRGDEERMADLFVRRMAHAYGAGLYGDFSRSSYEQALSRMDAAVLPRSSDVNGLLDQPMSAGFLGGLNLARKALTGRDTALYVSSLRDPRNPAVTTAAAEIQTELRTRYFNPAWLKANQAHGYDGAKTFMVMTDHLDLWDSTATKLVASADWAEVKAVFVDDKFKLGMDRFFDSANPHAQQMLLINLLGAAQRGHWQASARELGAIARRLTKSVHDHGPACEAGQCRNEAMTRFVAKSVATLPGGAAIAAGYRSAIQRATIAPGRAPGGAGAVALPQVPGGSPAARATTTPASPAAQTTPSPMPSPEITKITGRVMESISASQSPIPGEPRVRWLLLIAALGLVVFGAGASGGRARTA